MAISYPSKVEVVQVRKRLTMIPTVSIVTGVIASHSSGQHPSNTSVAGPVIYTQLSTSHQFSSKSPPGRCAVHNRPCLPVSTEATAQAHAPVPQAIVMPLPRSHVRIVNSVGKSISTKWTFVRLGNSS